MNTPQEIQDRNYRSQQPIDDCRVGKRIFLVHVLAFSITFVINAAITIFGMGIGVGLILADSFRSQPDTMINYTSSSTENGRNRSEATIMVSAETPTCRETIRRSMDRIQEPPPINLTAISRLPAQ